MGRWRRADGQARRSPPLGAGWPMAQRRLGRGWRRGEGRHVGEHPMHWPGRQILGEAAASPAVRLVPAGDAVSSIDMSGYNDVASRMREFFTAYPDGRLRPAAPWRVQTI